MNLVPRTLSLSNGPRLLVLALGMLLALSLSNGPLLAAPGPVRKGAVSAELVAAQDSIQPGKSFHVALKLNHDEHWHSYWINPGTGYPTSLKWNLPAGFTAGSIIWPTPQVVKDRRGQITGNGYEGETFLFVEITPPTTLKPGETVTLHAKADWLMCEDVCMPGVADLELTLPVTDGKPGPNMKFARLFNNAFGSLPKPMAGWDVSAARKGDNLTVRLKPAAGNTFRPEEIHLFDVAGLVDYSAEQKLAEENGSYVLTLKMAKDAPADATRLTGVLVSRNSWGPLFGSDGALFDVPLSGQSSAGNGQPGTSDPQVSGLRSQVSAAPTAKSGLAGTLLLALVGGLILNLMPCVFPVLGIKVLGFVHQSGNDRGKVVTHGLVFSLGVLLSFWALAGLLLALRAGGAVLGWGFQLQSPAFVFAMAAFLLVFALNLSGLFEVGLSATGVGGKLQMKDGYSGSFFTGVLATLVATPCSAPFLAPALGAAFSDSFSAAESILIFTFIAIGLAAPALLLSIFPAAVKMLPRPGAWMETFKQLMAFPLYATVGALLWVLAGQTKDDDYALLFIAFGLVLVAMAGWVYGRFGKPAGRLVAAVLLVAGLGLGWPKTIIIASDTGYAVKWEHWSPEAVAAAREAGRTIYVDFTARWCATCQTNKAAVFSSNAVLAEMEKRNVLLLKADWTSKDPAITAELAKWNRSAVPFNLIYLPGKEPVILPELLTPGRVLEALAQAAR
jgi:thiol:disulfide interchange protein/DsbC/DsbD-like thiol-disulfide interchange protein